MTTASDGGARPRIARAAGAQARQRRHRQRIGQTQLDFFGVAAPADPLFGAAVKLPAAANAADWSGPGKPPPCASVLCDVRASPRPDIARELKEIIKKFGAPTSEPDMIKGKGAVQRPHPRLGLWMAADRDSRHKCARVRRNADRRGRRECDRQRQPMVRIRLNRATVY